MSAVPASTKLSGLSSLLTQLQDLGPQTKLEVRSQGNHPGMHVTHNDIHHHLTELQLQQEYRARMQAKQAIERRRALAEHSYKTYPNQAAVTPTHRTFTATTKTYKHVPDATV
jgi:hypothetical protein